MALKLRLYYPPSD